MHICMLVYNYYPVAAGGAEHQCRLQTQALVEQGHTCSVLTARAHGSHPATEREDRLTVMRINTLQGLLSWWAERKGHHASSSPGARVAEQSARHKEMKAADAGGTLASVVKWVNAGLYMWGVYRYVRRRKQVIDVLHVHIASWNAGFATWLGHRFDIPVVCKGSNLPAFDHFERTVPFARVWTQWRKRGTFIALTQEMADDLMANGVAPDRVHIIPNGVLLPDDVSDVARNTSVLYVGNLTQGSDHKGFDILIAAWAKVHAVRPDARLSIAGRGESAPWRALAEEQGCGNALTFLGHVSDVSTCYLQAAAFVLPSRKEGVSNALLEAQSYGLPAVASNIPGNRQVIEDGCNGFLFPVEDQDALAERLIQLLDDASLRVRMGESARRVASERFSIGNVLRMQTRLYEQMIHDGDARTGQ